MNECSKKSIHSKGRTQEFGESADGNFACAAHELQQSGALLVVHLTHILQKKNKHPQSSRVTSVRPGWHRTYRVSLIFP